MVRIIFIFTIVVTLGFISVKGQEPQVREQYNNAVEEAKKGNLDVAIQFFTNAVKLDSDYSQAYTGRGLAYMRKRSNNPILQKQNLDSAIYDFSRAIELNPKWVGGYINRSSVYSLTKEFDKALADLQKAEEIDPKYAYIFAARGSVYSKMKEYQLAIDSVTKAIEINPYSYFYNQRCLAYYDFNKYENAVADCSQAIALNPKDSMAFYNRGLSRIKLEQIALAITDFRNALNINPNFILAKNQLDTLLKNNKY